MSRKANRRKKRHRKQLNRCLFRQFWNINILFQSTAAFLSKLNIVLSLFSGTRYKIVYFVKEIDFFSIWTVLLIYKRIDTICHEKQIEEKKGTENS